MTEVYVGSVDEVGKVGTKIVNAGGLEIGVICWNDEFFAFENTCLHQGGPVCEGTLIGKVETVLGPSKDVMEERYSPTDMHLVCPWHGYEYELRSGVCAADRRLSLRTFEVTCRNGKVFLVI